MLGSDTDTGFVALINDGGKNVERFNYREMEGLVVNTLDGNDYVVLDDVIAPTTINLGLDDDRIQIGQVFRSERVKNPDGRADQQHHAPRTCSRRSRSRAAGCPTASACR